MKKRGPAYCSHVMIRFTLKTTAGGFEKNLLINHLDYEKQQNLTTIGNERSNEVLYKSGEVLRYL